MNLDDRARQARTSLEHHVQTDLDLRGARADLEARGRRQVSDRHRARAAVGVLGVLALLGGYAVVSGSDGRSPDGTRDPGELAIDEDGGGQTLADEEMIEAMPLGPTDGKESWRLPVAVSPQSGLQEGDTVTIYGRGFEPNDSLGVVHCSSEADTENAGVAACELGADQGFAPVQYVNADANGDVVADITVRRFIETPGYGRIDCASAPERCLLGMGAISNYDRSGGAYIDFAGAPEFAMPTFTVAGGGQQLTPGQEVQVDVTDWVPGRQLRIRQCVVEAGGFDGTERCEALLDTRADGVGAFSGVVVVNAEVIDDAGQVPCDGNCVLQATGIGIPEGTTSPFPDALPITFAEGAGEITTTTHAGTTTTPPPVAGNPATSGADTTTSIVDGGPATTVPGTAPSTDAGAQAETEAGSGG